MEFQLTRTSPILSTIASMAAKVYELPVCSPDIAGFMIQIQQKVQETRDALEADMKAAGINGTCPPCPTPTDCPVVTCPSCPPATQTPCPPCECVTPRGGQQPTIQDRTRRTRGFGSIGSMPKVQYSAGPTMMARGASGRMEQVPFDFNRPAMLQSLGNITMAEFLQVFPSGTEIIRYDSFGNQSGKFVYGENYGSGITVSECQARKILAAAFPEKASNIQKSGVGIVCPE